MLNNKRKLKSTINPEAMVENKEIKKPKCKFIMPEIREFFNSPKKQEVEDKSDDNTSDEDDNSEHVAQKRYLTKAERAALSRQEEARLTKIEMQLADNTREPESADEFDRLLLANPNSSELWIKYISFHLAATEIDKARSIAKKALQTINMIYTQEKLNIWTARINLECIFGTEESFKEVFREALKFNDPLKIYLKVIEIFAEYGKTNEIEELIKKIRHRHKQNPLFWTEIARIFYQFGNFNEARNLKNCALKSIMDKKTQINLIIRFAIMEFKYGETEYGCTIFDTILTSDPKRVNIWSLYVDQLVKKGRIDEARQILQRALQQSLPAKKLQSLKVKLKNFQDKFGDDNVINTTNIVHNIVTTKNKC